MPNELMKTLTIGANTYDLPQKTSDLTNDSGFLDEAVLWVTLTVDKQTETFTADYTYTEIDSAIREGKTVLVCIGDQVQSLIGWDAGEDDDGEYRIYVFSYVVPYATTGIFSVRFRIDRTNTWEGRQYIYSIPTKTSDLTNDSGFITTETDPTVPSWAKASSKPSYTASEVGAAASSHTHGNITNSGDITTNATIASGDRIVINDESASKIQNSSVTFGSSTTQYLANNGTWQNVPTVPTKTSDLTNDSGFITSTTADDTYLPKSVTTAGGLENSITYAQPSREESSVTITSKYIGKAQLELYTNGAVNQNGARIKVGTTSSPTTILSTYYTSSATYTSISSTNTTISSTTTTINGVVTPTADGMAANKKYVDDSITAAIGTAIGGSY